jgi:hypothetical protein
LTTTTLLGSVLDAERPDLVVFTGDQLNGQGTSWDPKSVLAKFAAAVTDRGLPWAAVFGNHDDAEENGVPKEELMKLMRALPYNLVEPGPKDVHGVGNYVLKVMSADALVIPPSNPNLRLNRDDIDRRRICSHFISLILAVIREGFITGGDGSRQRSMIGYDRSVEVSRS